jgi:polysaccharide biosynthesis/export protein
MVQAVATIKVVGTTPKPAPRKGAEMLRFLAVIIFAFMSFSGTMAFAADAPKAAGRTYTINPGDEIEIYVWGEERLQRMVRILPDGSFAFPLVGRIIAAGKTPTAIETEISQGLKTQYRGEVPQVTVSVKAPSGMTFSIIGKVKGPGTFTPGRYLNILEALSLSGGADEFANLDNVTIIRKAATGLQIIKVRLSAVLKGSATITAESLPLIETGDTVIVP